MPRVVARRAAAFVFPFFPFRKNMEEFMAIVSEAAESSAAVAVAVAAETPVHPRGPGLVDIYWRWEDSELLTLAGGVELAAVKKLNPLAGLFCAGSEFKDQPLEFAIPSAIRYAMVAISRDTMQVNMFAESAILEMFGAPANDKHIDVVWIREAVTHAMCLLLRGRGVWSAPVFIAMIVLEDFLGTSELRAAAVDLAIRTVDDSVMKDLIDECVCLFLCTQETAVIGDILTALVMRNDEHMLATCMTNADGTRKKVHPPIFEMWGARAAIVMGLRCFDQDQCTSQDRTEFARIVCRLMRSTREMEFRSGISSQETTFMDMNFRFKGRPKEPRVVRPVMTALTRTNGGRTDGGRSFWNAVWRMTDATSAGLVPLTNELWAQQLREDFVPPTAAATSTLQQQPGTESAVPIAGDGAAETTVVTAGETQDARDYLLEELPIPLDWKVVPKPKGSSRYEWIAQAKVAGTRRILFSGKFDAVRWLGEVVRDCKGAVITGSFVTRAAQQIWKVHGPKDEEDSGVPPSRVTGDWMPADIDIFLTGHKMQKLADHIRLLACILQRHPKARMWKSTRSRHVMTISVDGSKPKECNGVRAFPESAVIIQIVNSCLATPLDVLLRFDQTYLQWGYTGQLIFGTLEAWAGLTGANWYTGSQITCGTMAKRESDAVDRGVTLPGDGVYVGANYVQALNYITSNASSAITFSAQEMSRVHRGMQEEEMLPEEMASGKIPMQDLPLFLEGPTKIEVPKGSTMDRLDEHSDKLWRALEDVGDFFYYDREFSELIVAASVNAIDYGNAVAAINQTVENAAGPFWQRRDTLVLAFDLAVVCAVEEAADGSVVIWVDPGLVGMVKFLDAVRKFAGQFDIVGAMCPQSDGFNTEETAVAVRARLTEMADIAEKKGQVPVVANHVSEWYDGNASMPRVLNAQAKKLGVLALSKLLTPMKDVVSFVGQIIHYVDKTEPFVFVAQAVRHVKFPTPEYTHGLLTMRRACEEEQYVRAGGKLKRQLSVHDAVEEAVENKKRKHAASDEDDSAAAAAEEKRRGKRKRMEESESAPIPDTWDDHEEAECEMKRKREDDEESSGGPSEKRVRM